MKLEIDKEIEKEIIKQLDMYLNAAGIGREKKEKIILHLSD